MNTVGFATNLDLLARLSGTILPAGVVAVLMTIPSILTGTARFG